MKLLAIADYHGKSAVLEPLLNQINTLKPDVICYAGDVVRGYKRGDEWLASKREARAPVKTAEIIAEGDEDETHLNTFYSKLATTNIPVMTIPGNMDAPTERYFNIMSKITATYKNINLVHAKLELYRDIGFIGYGGEISDEERSETFFVMITKASEVKSKLELELTNLKHKPFILITHQPPKAQKVDTEDGVNHRGSVCVTDIIQVYQPLISISGHIHSAQGFETIGKTLVVNPGALKSGNCALIEFDPTLIEEKLPKVEFIKLQL